VRIIVDPIVPREATSGTPATKFRAKASSKGRQPAPKDELSRDFRAELYYAHSAFQDLERGSKILGRLPGTEEQIERIRGSVDPGIIVDCEKKIGPEWSYILRHDPHSYSGLSVADLAMLVDESLGWWQKTIYAFESRAVHANDPFKHIQMSCGNSAKALFHSTNSEVYATLRSAITMFLIHIRILHESIGFGPEVKVEYDSFKRKMDRLKWDAALDSAGDFVISPASSKRQSCRSSNSGGA